MSVRHCGQRGLQNRHQENKLLQPDGAGPEGDGVSSGENGTVCGRGTVPPPPEGRCAGGHTQATRNHPHTARGREDDAPSLPWPALMREQMWGVLWEALEGRPLTGVGKKGSSHLWEHLEKILCHGHGPLRGNGLPRKGEEGREASGQRR